MAENPETAAARHELSVTPPVHVILENKKEPEKHKPWYLSPEAIAVAKWLVGTVGVGLFGLWINHNAQEKQIERQNIESDASIIRAISTKFDTSLSIQISYFRYIEPFVKTPSLRDSIDAILNRIDPSFIHLKKIDSASPNLSHVSKQVISEMKKDTEATVLKPQTSVIKDEQAVAPGLKVVQTAAVIIDSIENRRKDAAPLTINSYELSNPPVTQWCKKNYFVIYSNTLKIGINDLDNVGVYARLTDLTAFRNAADSVISANRRLTIGSPAEIFSKDEKLKYLINLDYIGKAGVNPFKKAAFITVTTYSKH
ncbi:MAG TPA: hypothetical protein VHA56_08820 [Mucilaginibacter sp.]|nr:hypothetical protein [Mucilaginibacter sp.]